MQLSRIHVDAHACSGLGFLSYLVHQVTLSYSTRSSCSLVSEGALPQGLWNTAAPKDAHVLCRASVQNWTRLYSRPDTRSTLKLASWVWMSVNSHRVASSVQPRGFSRRFWFDVEAAVYRPWIWEAGCTSLSGIAFHNCILGFKECNSLTGQSKLGVVIHTCNPSTCLKKQKPSDWAKWLRR